ncbi:MAG: poly-gamma-glutamate biosynthesis protein PgsC/CapC [Snowella sp.]|nr:poly-gamma-glutamate biosynthesis protein PgsC/CapC [Snowella sp.]
MLIENFNTPEIYRLTLMVGAIISIVYKNIYNILPGGVIIPGLIIISGLMSPLWLLTLIVITIIIDAIYRQFFMKTYALRRTPLYILGIMSLILGGSIGLIYMDLGIINPELDNLIGSFGPAVVCNVMIRQKKPLVLRGIAICSGLTLAVVVLIYFVFGSLFQVEMNSIYPITRGKEHIDIAYSPLSLTITLVTSYLIYYFKKIRSGGYLIAPFIVALLVSPVGCYLFFLGFILIRWLTQWICRWSFIIGLDRYALTLCLSTIYVWGIDLLFIALDSSILPFLGSSLLIILALMSYVNDSILYADQNIYVYMAISVVLAWLVNLFFEYILKLALL